MVVEQAAFCSSTKVTQPTFALIYSGCQKPVALFEGFFYNHFYYPSLFRNLFLGIYSIDSEMELI